MKFHKTDGVTIWIKLGTIKYKVLKGMGRGVVTRASHTLKEPWRAMTFLKA